MGMFYNGANCDIYIGKGAGRKLMNDIQGAGKSVKIISPYLSPFLISELIKLHNKGIEVQLITVDKIEDYYDNYDKNIFKLIRQHRNIDEEAQAKRDKWIKSTRILLASLCVLTALVVLLFSHFNNFKILFGIIPLIIILFIYKTLIKKIKTERIYHYNYSLLFNFKVFESPYSNCESDTFIHSKVYLIDDSIAYLGSLNFTASGTKHNYETRIRTVDKQAVNEMKKEFQELFYNSRIPERSISDWGRKIYGESIN